MTSNWGFNFQLDQHLEGPKKKNGNCENSIRNIAAYE
jgi:hypothetical protein